MLLLKCADCGMMNGLDGQFCRQCGRAIPVDDLARARQEMVELIADGERLLSQKRLPEAMTIASAAMEADPAYGPAVRLYSEILVKQGRIGDAVEALEHLARMEPENDVVRARIAELTAGSRSQASRLSPPMQIIVTALGLTLILAAVGTAFTLAARPAKKDATLVAEATPQGRSSFDVVAPVPAPDIVRNQSSTAPAASVTGVQETKIASDAVPTPPPGATTPAQPVRQTTSVEVPQVSRGNDLSRAPALTAKPANGDPAPAANPLPETDVAATKPTFEAAPVVPKSTGTIEISVRANQSAKPSTGPSESSPNEVKTLISVARERYARGEYEGAAGAYEKALKAGADSGTTNQRLGGCYEKLGRKDDAVTAYRRAITAYEAQNNKKPEARLERAIQACRKAIEVLEAGEQ